MIEIERMKIPPEGADPASGRIVWDPVQSIWTLAMAGVGLAARLRRPGAERWSAG